jgi:PadR family transcriptional regulator PadR
LRNGGVRKSSEGDPGLLLYSQRSHDRLALGNNMTEENNRKARADVWQGTLSMMVLKTLDMLGPQHGYGIARRIEQTSQNLLSINQGTLYPVLLKLEQERSIASEWGVSENNRRARFYSITRRGKKELAVEERQWQQAHDILARFADLGREAPGEETL